MKIFKLTSMAFAVAMIAVSCRITEKIDPNLDIPGLGGYEYPEMELDVWLKEFFLDEYNIEVIYRWDAVKMYTDTSHKLVPAQMNKVRPMMQSLARVWFEPYMEVAADYGFVQKYAPKTIVLAGSPEYQSANVMVLGSADDGIKIFLTNVNAFSPTNRAVLKDYMHIIEHEFVHILNQNVNYGKDFHDISAGTYEPTTWNDYTSEEDAYIRGFLSRYSMVSPDEDYAELISLLLVYGMDWINKEVLPKAELSEIDPKAAEKIRKKIDHISDYLDNAFGIMLQDDPVSGEKGFITHVQEAIDYVIEDALANEL